MAASVIQRRVRRRVTLRDGLTRWTFRIAQKSWARERSAMRRERSAAVMLAQDKLLADALDSLESANDVLRRYEDRLFWLEKEESLRRDGTFKHLELRRRVLTSKADVFESAGSLEEAITTLHELCKLQAEEMAPAAECVHTLSRLADLMRRARPIREAVGPLKMLLTVEKQLQRPALNWEAKDDEDEEEEFYRQATNIVRPKRRGSLRDASSKARTVAEEVAAELLELYQGEKMLDEAFQLMFSEVSPVSKKEQRSLEAIVVSLQRSYRKRAAASSKLCAGERGRQDRALVRNMRLRRDAATKIECSARRMHARRVREGKAEEKRQNKAAMVLQRSHRRKVEGKKPQWPIRLSIMAARAQRRRTSVTGIDEKERRLSKNMPDPMARKTTLRGEGLVLARRMSIISDTSDDGEDAASQMRRASRAFDPRPQQEVDDD